jgi:hypothetical protein
MVPDACPGPDPGFVGTTSGCRIKSGMTKQAVYKQSLFIVSRVEKDSGTINVLSD